MVSSVISLAVITLCLTANCDAVTRQKRIVYGRPLVGRDGEYSAVRYYAWISNGRECEMKPWYLPWAECKAHPAYLQCGGAFITPKLVSTACHCVSWFEPPVLNVEFSKGFAGIVDHWENRYAVFFGDNDVTAMPHRILTAGWFIHANCATVYNFNISAAIVYDFAWIMLSSSPLDAPAEYQPLYDFAPQYTLDDLAAIWHYAVQNEAVCLYMGFGKFEFQPGFEHEDVTTNENAQYLRHGWGLNLNYVSCKETTDLPIPDELRPDVFNYSNDAAYSCGKPFGMHKARIGLGDSGGPVTCNNYLLGVFSGGKYVYYETYVNATTLTFDNVFSPYENSINYRKAFIAFVEEYGELPYDGFPEDLPTFKPRKFHEISSKTQAIYCSKFIVAAVAFSSFAKTMLKFKLKYLY